MRRRATSLAFWNGVPKADSKRFAFPLKPPITLQAKSDVWAAPQSSHELTPIIVTTGTGHVGTATLARNLLYHPIDGLACMARLYCHGGGPNLEGRRSRRQTEEYHVLANSRRGQRTTPYSCHFLERPENRYLPRHHADRELSSFVRQAGLRNSSRRLQHP